MKRRLVTYTVIAVAGIVLVMVAHPIVDSKIGYRGIYFQMKEAISTLNRDPSSQAALTEIQRIVDFGTDWEKVQLYEILTSECRRGGLGGTYVVDRVLVPVVRRGINDANSLVRETACNCIAASPALAIAMVDDLVAIMKRHGSATISRYAAVALGQSRTQRDDVIELLVSGLKYPQSQPDIDGIFSQNDGLRDECIQALMLIAPTSTDAMDGIMHYINDSDQLFRARVAMAILAIDPKSIFATEIIKAMVGNAAERSSVRSFILTNIDRIYKIESIGDTVVRVANNIHDPMQSDAQRALDAVASRGKP